MTPPIDLRPLEGLARDLRHALRALRRAPAFASTAVLTLTLAIGTATAMLTVLHAVVLRELPVRDPDRIVALASHRDPTVPLAGVLAAAAVVASLVPALRASRVDPTVALRAE